MKAKSISKQEAQCALVFVICGFIKIFFKEILTSYCKFIMSKALKWCMLRLYTLIFQEDIHKNALKNLYNW